MLGVFPDLAVPGPIQWMEQRDVSAATGDRSVDGGGEGGGSSRGFFSWAARSVSLGNSAAVSVLPVYAKLGEDRRG